MIIPILRHIKNPKKEEQNRQLRKENFCKKANSHRVKRASENNLNNKNYEITHFYNLIYILEFNELLLHSSI